MCKCCDTCDYCDKTGSWPYCNIADEPIDLLRVPYLLEKVGCASHSSFHIQNKSYIITEDELKRYENNCSISLKIQGDNIRSRNIINPKTVQQELISSVDIIDNLKRDLEWHKKRINMLQCWQSSMRDPERKIVYDIITNGFTLTSKETIDNAANTAYGNLPKEVTDELSPLIDGMCGTLPFLMALGELPNTRNYLLKQIKSNKLSDELT